MPSCSLPWLHGNMYTWEYVMCLRCTGFLEATKITVGKALILTFFFWGGGR